MSAFPVEIWHKDLQRPFEFQFFTTHAQKKGRSFNSCGKIMFYFWDHKNPRTLNFTQLCVCVSNHVTFHTSSMYNEIIFRRIQWPCLFPLIPHPPALNVTPQHLTLSPELSNRGNNQKQLSKNPNERVINFFYIIGHTNKDNKIFANKQTQSEDLQLNEVNEVFFSLPNQKVCSSKWLSFLGKNI